MEMANHAQCKRFVVSSIKSTNQVLTNRKQQISSEQNFWATLASFLPHFYEPTQFKKHANLGVKPRAKQGARLPCRQRRRSLRRNTPTRWLPTARSIRPFK
jgi:hypothetical protein